MCFFFSFFICRPSAPSAVESAGGRFVAQAGPGHKFILHAGAEFAGADLSSVSCLNQSTQKQYIVNES